MVTSEDTACLLVHAGPQLCAIPLGSVVETMRPLPIERIQGAPGALLGVSVVRGGAVPVVDLARLISGETSEPRRWVLARTQERSVALAATDVLGVSTLTPEAIEPGAALAASIAAPCVSAITCRGGRSIAILDVDRVLDPYDHDSAGAEHGRGG